MITPEFLRDGHLMFGPIGGFVPGVVPVGVGQLALATVPVRKSWKSWWKIRHVGVVVIENGKPWIVQAMPNGAEMIPLTAKHWTREYVYIDPGYPETMGARVANAARGYVGTPYSFLDYAAILGVHLGVKNGPIRRYVRSTGHMICSQLADQSLADAGFHVFNDGRLPQDVMPAELYRALRTMPGTRWMQPGLFDWGWMR